MKTLGVVSLFIGVYLSHTLFDPIGGQLMYYDVNNTFKNMTDDFGMVTRGAYNLSSCVKEMFNCWELIRTEMLCRIMKAERQYYYWSMCDVIRSYCVNVDGLMTASSGFRLYERVCRDFTHEIIPTIPPE